ncbi:MAG: sigma-54-dependent Fis family transcriptional regulator [Gemmatimonadetes bacterium]|nr:sigma-54-dependent Fis family transcriptional regulator [Gemmatimonadota bacterium]MYF72001.1 sigma-54-dependent Fis family transcriptional regulator [Gemmatimonadota bacterium]MYK50628.1 sigma-54-dependent Fis family transcriptional regulator [Gemmatimonadota bacterium]
MSLVLVIDDNETMRSGMALLLERMGHDVTAASGGVEGLRQMNARPFDLVITDYKMEDMDGLEVLDAVRRDYADTDVVVITAYGTIDVAVEAMRKGAADFVVKADALYDVLRLRVEKVLKHRELRQSRDRLDEENQYLRDEIGVRFNFGEMVGRSKPMKTVYEMVEKVAETDSAVLVYGESGTGKELVARAIHRRSARREGPFVKVNCGSLPRELVQSELFGHEKGAFTGAIRQKKGKFELAEGGTIFLDEIGDLPLEAQVNILRVLQAKEYDRVGGEETIQADVRVIAATHRVLREMVAEGAFREDLFYRLEVIPIRLVPLRDRKADIPDLVEHFLHKKCEEMNRPLKRLTDRAMAAMASYTWPGNVRELENVVERTLVLADGNVVDVNDLPLDVEASRAEVSAEELEDSAIPLTRRLEDLERQLIEQALEQAGGVKTKAAEMLGIKTSAFYYKLDKYGLT